MKSLFEQMGGTYRQEGDYLMLCEFLLFSLQSPHLCNMKQNGYQNAAFGCFVLMPFYDIVSFTVATTITGIPASLSATLHPF